MKKFLQGLFCVLLLLAVSPANAQEPPWVRPAASSHTLHVGKAIVQVDFGPGTADLPDDRILQWVEHAA